jgi:excinuclease ABC subunit B
VQPTYAQSTTIPTRTRAKKPSLDDMGPGTDRPEPLRDEDAVSRIRKPSLDEMGSARNRPIPARDHAPSPLRGEGRGLPSAKAEGEGQPRPLEGQDLAPRTSNIDPRTKAGAYGEKISGPHKPTLDEMGPHAERGLPVAGKPRPTKPQTPTYSPPHHAEGVPSTRSGEGLGVGGTRDTTKKKHRHGRPKKTGRPGQ